LRSGQRKRPVDHVGDVSGEAAAVLDDDKLQLVPHLGPHVAVRDAEIAADIGDHGAERLAAQESGNLLRRRQFDEIRRR
jgi:hypothetical protein